MLLAELFCNGIPLSSTVDGFFTYTTPLTNNEVYAIALAHLDSAIAAAVPVAGNLRADTLLATSIKNGASIAKGRVLVDLGRYSDAAAAVAGVDQVPCELRHPHLVRLTGDPCDLHRARLERHDEEDDVADQPAQGQYVDGEEVGGREPIPMSREERLPGRLRAALWGRLDALVLEDGGEKLP
jgi:hypothetical protein